MQCSPYSWRMVWFMIQCSSGSSFWDGIICSIFSREYTWAPTSGSEKTEVGFGVEGKNGYKGALDHGFVSPNRSSESKMIHWSCPILHSHGWAFTSHKILPLLPSSASSPHFRQSLGMNHLWERHRDPL